MEIILDKKGGKLRLSKTFLTEVTGCVVPEAKWRVRLTTLKATGDFAYANIVLTGKHTRCGDAFVHYSHRQIGCRYFSDSVYAKIMRAAKIENWR